MILRAEGIEKRFDERLVLRGASLEISPGSVTILRGANGSGKTTLAAILATLLAPDRGAVTVDGEPWSRRRKAARRAIGYASHRSLVYPGLTPIENLVFFGRLLDLPKPHARATELAEGFGMTPYAHAPVERFSRGMLQRVVLARAVLANPAILILDEPYAGLDDDGVTLVNDVLRAAAARGAGALVVTHEADHARGIATRTLRLHDGRTAAAA